MQDASTAAPAGRSKKVHPNSLANLRSMKPCPGCGFMTGNRKSGICGKPITVLDDARRKTLLLNEKGDVIRCQHIFEIAAQRRLKAAGASSIAERKLLLLEGASHMAVSHVEESFVKLVTKVRMARLLIASI